MGFKSKIVSSGISLFIFLFWKFKNFIDFFFFVYFPLNQNFHIKSEVVGSLQRIFYTPSFHLWYHTINHRWYQCPPDTFLQVRNSPYKSQYHQCHQNQGNPKVEALPVSNSLHPDNAVGWIQPLFTVFLTSFIEILQKKMKGRKPAITQGQIGPFFLKC